MCPICSSKLGWQSDFTCEEVHGCDCDKGVVSFWTCSECKAFVQVTTYCEQYNESD